MTAAAATHRTRTHQCSTGSRLAPRRSPPVSQHGTAASTGELTTAPDPDAIHDDYCAQRHLDWRKRPARPGRPAAPDANLPAALRAH
jgi:hypothetical protein